MKCDKCERPAVIHFTNSVHGQVTHQKNWCDACAPTQQELLNQHPAPKAAAAVTNDPMTTAEAGDLHEAIRLALRACTRDAGRLRDHCSKNGRPEEARRLALVITKLEEARLWLDASAVL